MFLVVEGDNPRTSKWKTRASSNCCVEISNKLICLIKNYSFAYLNNRQYNLVDTKREKHLSFLFYLYLEQSNE